MGDWNVLGCSGGGGRWIAGGLGRDEGGRERDRETERECVWDDGEGDGNLYDWEGMGEGVGGVRREGKMD